MYTNHLYGIFYLMMFLEDNAKETLSNIEEMWNRKLGLFIVDEYIYPLVISSKYITQGGYSSLYFQAHDKITRKGRQTDEEIDK